MLGESKYAAIKRYLSVEKRFKFDLDFRHEYTRFIKELIEMGHMELIPANEIDRNPHYYLPHHAIFKASTTTSCRVVFDASARTSSGSSLNDHLYVGPTIQDGLYAIILRFRLHKIVFSADIAKMFRQICVSDQDTDYQRIVWREDPSQPIQNYRILRVVYGMAASSYLATKCLQTIATQYQNTHAESSAIIKDSFYMDDLMAGADSIPAALKIQKELIFILNSAGFDLRKWISNSPELLDSLPADKREISPLEISEEGESIKVLGLQWNPQLDQFRFKVTLTERAILTKRGMLSEASRLFDPLGWITPITTSIKILFQKLWLPPSIEWDTELPEEIKREWMKLHSELPEVEKYEIPRWLGLKKEAHYQLHGFCDASTMAYAAVIYVRYVNDDNEVITTLLTSKTKVAPIKTISLPKLELCGALLLARLIKVVLESLKEPNVNIYGWYDSRIVLSWLSDLPRRWKTFIANRTSEILETVPTAHWNYVPSKSNPADIATRSVVSLC